MYAVIATGGKQYKVVENEILDIERLSGDVGEKINFSEVLAIGEGDKCEFGSPLLADKVVEAEIIDHFRGTKLTVFKMKRRKGYRRKYGHRQELTKVKIVAIDAAAAAPKKKAAKKAAAPKEPEAEVATEAAATE